MSWVTALPPLQVNPASMTQVEEQPSPDTVLPSSQASTPAFKPSPHTERQALEEVDPAEEKVATGHVVQTEAPPREYVLTGH